MQKTPTMSLTAQRYAEIDAELRRIDAYLLALALEIDETTPAATRRGKTYQAAMDAAGQIFNLQERLREDKELAPRLH
jgi:hypothetical protein